ncbi:MAG TPA: hypothetical protein VMU02_05530 [bacterium]|nr:hypothetical protein [bacterium]
MAVRIVITPEDTMWWLMRPEFLADVDEVVLDPADYDRVKRERLDSEYRAVVWKRLQVLGDNGMLRSDSVKIDWDHLNLMAERKIREILCDSEKTRIFVSDMLFAYRYWVEFNQQRLDIMPIEDDYAESVRLHMPVWRSDLALLERRGKMAFVERPEIVEQTARSILVRVCSLREITIHHAGVAFASMKEFQPFLKYTDCGPDTPLPPGALEVIRGYLPREPWSPSRDLPIEPQMDFLRFDLTKRGFWEHISELRASHKGVRAALGSMLAYLDDMARSLVGGCLDAEAVNGYLRTSEELDDLELAGRRTSAYLKKSLYGLSLVPTRALSRMLRIASGEEMPAGETAPGQLGQPDQAKQGSVAQAPPAYYGILESLLDLTQSKPPRQAKPHRRRAKVKIPGFWRTTT